MKIMGTGSRSMVTEPNAKAIYSNLKEQILMMKEKDPDITLISGMAEGWDEAIAKVGMRESIPYDVYIPHPTYGEYYWGKNSFLRYNRMAEFKELVDHAREVKVVCAGIYYAGIHSNFHRNQVMINNCDGALVYKPTSPGTRDAIARLKTAKKPYLVYPFDLQQHLF